MPISTFSPIYSEIAHPLEKCAFLRGAVNFFDFGQTAYNICYYDNNQKIEVIETKREKLSWVKTLLRVAAFATVVIPLLMAIGASIYKSINYFHNARNELKNVPHDILSFIFYKLGPSILRIATTNKENNQIIEITKPLKEDQTIYKALEKSYFLARGLKRSMKADKKPN